MTKSRGAIRLVIGFFLATLPALAQQKLDCAKFNSPGCRSFNELVASKDRDILSTINSTSAVARVCFIEGTDSFIIVSYTVPPKSLWRKSEDGTTNTAGPLFWFFTQYDDGIYVNSLLFETIWTTLGDNGDWTANGRVVPKGIESLSISADQITVSLTTNSDKSRTPTTYELSMTASTGRFKATFESKDQNDRALRSTQIGHCASYGNGIPKVPHPSQ
jgi:hypothetical protein